MGGKREVSRVQYGGVSDVKSRSVEFFKDNLCHPFSIGWSVPCGLCDEDWVVDGIDSQNILQSMADEWGYRIEVFN